MKIKIRECVGNARIYREDGTLVGTINGWPKNGPVREICGIDGQVIYRVRKEKGRCVVEDGPKAAAGSDHVVLFQYEAKSEGENDKTGSDSVRSGPSTLFRAPLAVMARLSLPSGSLTIRQNRKREFALENESGAIGRITKAASLGSYEVVCEGVVGIYDAAAAFVIAEYMYHDDDLEVV